jgi:hypothetical protein
MDQPIEYVGGEPERPPRKPWWLLAAVPTVLVLGVGGVVLGPGLVAGVRSFSQEALPYTVQVSGTWSSQDQIVGAPIDLSLQLKNTDTRILNGVTLRMTGLAPMWRVLSATPDGQVSDSRTTAIYFAHALRPTETETLLMHLMPVQSGQSELHLSMAAGRTSQTMRLVTGTGTARGLIATVSVRDAGPSDLTATAHLYYSDPNLVNVSSLFKMHVDNTGVVRITSVTVRFAQLPSAFELQSSEPAGSAGSDGRSSTFVVNLDPGQGTDINIYYVPHQLGRYHVSIQLYLQDQAQPLVLQNGKAAIDVDITVH